MNIKRKEGEEMNIKVSINVYQEVQLMIFEETGKLIPLEELAECGCVACDADRYGNYSVEE